MSKFFGYKFGPSTQKSHTNSILYATMVLGTGVVLGKGFKHYYEKIKESEKEKQVGLIVGGSLIGILGIGMLNVPLATIGLFVTGTGIGLL